MGMNPLIMSGYWTRNGSDIFPLMEGLTMTGNTISKTDRTSEMKATGSVILPVDWPYPVDREHSREGEK